jgi:hypothetical protein
MSNFSSDEFVSYDLSHRVILWDLIVVRQSNSAKVRNSRTISSNPTKFNVQHNRVILSKLNT